MIHATRPRLTDTICTGARRRFARIASVGGLFLLSMIFAALPVAADKHGGNSGGGSDDTVQTGQQHHDGDSRGQGRIANEPGDDRGMAEDEPGDDRGMVENEPGDDKGQAGNEPGDDNGVDANGAGIIPVLVSAAMNTRR